MPTLAIVDSRNVHGQSSDVLGTGACPTVAGVIDGLGVYGFDVTEVQIGLALARSRDGQALAAEHAENLRYKQEIESDGRGVVLLGELHLKELGPPRKVEEKIVDVQCALAVALTARDIADNRSPFDSIVVCSQDVDIRPALEYAVDQLGVPVWVAAHAVVDRRPQPHLLLTADALRRFRPPNGPCGHAKRALVAAAAAAPDERTWTAVEPFGVSDMWSLVDADGTPGMCHSNLLGPAPQPGMNVRLGVAGVSGSTFRFPIIYCGRQPASTPLVEEGKVVRRVRHDRLEIDVGGTRHRLYYPAGGVLPGGKVAVYTPRAQGGSTSDLLVVGPLAAPQVTNHLKLRVLSGEPVVATATAKRLSDYRTEMSSPLGPLVLDHARGGHPPDGQRLAVVLADSGTYRFRPVAHAVSSTLP